MADNTRQNDQTNDHEGRGGGHPRNAAGEAERMKEQGVNMTPRQVRETAEVNRELRDTSPFSPEFQSEAGRKGGLTGAGGEAVKEKYIDSWRGDNDQSGQNDQNSRSNENTSR